MVGPLAWDWVARVPAVPALGGFVQASSVVGRCGGSGGNTARVLADLGARVELVGYVGSDEMSAGALQTLRDGGVGTSFVTQLEGPMSQVVVLVDDDGERTMVGVAPDRLADVPWPEVAQGDTVVVSGWYPQFADLARASRAGTLVCVPFEAPTGPVPVTHVVGSVSQLPEVGDPWEYYARATAGACRAVVLTDGPRAVTVLTDARRDLVHVPAVRAVDATGAGDAFLAGFVRTLLDDRPLEECVAHGVQRGSASVQHAGALPEPGPGEDSVQERTCGTRR